jgi:hypothetical protein
MHKRYTILSLFAASLKKNGLRAALTAAVRTDHGLARPKIISIPGTRALYIAVPKCANSSMKALIARIVHDTHPDIPFCDAWPPRMFNDDSNRNLLRDRKILLDRNELTTYTGHCIFTVVRNPWDRLLSAYTEKILKYSDKPLPSFFDLYGNRFYHRMSFEAFVEAVFSIPDEFANHHFSSQVHLLRRRDCQELVPGRILKMEDFPGAIDDLLAELGLAGYKFPHLLRSDHANYRDMYSPYTRDLAARRYHDDIAAFGYAF